VLFLSNMIESKGPLVLLDALELLSQQGLQVEATFAGGAHIDGCLARFLARLSASPISDRVRYVGPIYGTAKCELFREHDIFVHPTSDDAFPVVVLEAMQHGLGVIASRVGAIPEMVIDEETGLLTEPGNASSVARAIATLVTQAELRERMAAAGTRRFAERYTLENFEQRLSSVMASCV
jgi:glycosyltransferase involved in cell wall biosynthesis